MIVNKDTTHEISEGLNKRINKALKFIKENDLSLYPNTTIEIDGKRVYAMLQYFDVKQPIDVEFETHRKYLDIQYVISGELKICIANSSDLFVNGEYDPDNDVIFYKRSDKYTTISLQKGEYAILFPTDAHRMICHPENGDCPKIRKCVIKVQVDD